jgi:diguanylate cyclase
MLMVLVVITALVIGLVCGWWLRGAESSPARVSSAQEASAPTREVLERLRELTRHVASDVDKHKTLMGRITRELHAAPQSDPSAVLQAVGRLIQSNEQMQQQLQSAEARLQHQAQQIANHAIEARTDALTALANRREFDKAMEEAHRTLREKHTPATVMMIDIDHFKHLNDSYGHQAGDEVLRQVAHTLQARLPEECLIARYGGEEFAVVFLGVHFAEVEHVAERARRAIGEQEVAFEGLRLRVTASGGLAELMPGETIPSVISRADDALYISKETGRNRGHVHDGKTVSPLARRSNVVARAIEHPDQPAPYEIGISSPEVFASDLSRRLSQWNRGGSPLCVLLVRIDDLDEIAQRHGAENRHAAMRAMVLALKAVMREIDHAARFDAQAIALLLPGCALRGAVATAERLRAAAARCELPARYDRRRFTVSIGVAAALEDEEEDALIDRVRQSLQVACTYGENCTYLHDGLDVHLIGAGPVTMAT